MENQERDNRHRKEIIIAIVISVLTILYFVVYFGFLVYLVESFLAKFLFAIIPLAFSAAMIHICIERIKEIKEGEIDDAGKY